MRTVALFGAALMLLSQYSLGNETNEFFGDSSWQFRSPSERNVLINQEVVRQSKNGVPLPGGATSGGSNGSSALGVSPSNINNFSVIEVHVEGSGNTVNANSDQDSKDTNQSNDTNIEDNDIDSEVNSEINNNEGGTE